METSPALDGDVGRATVAPTTGRMAGWERWGEASAREAVAGREAAAVRANHP